MKKMVPYVIIPIVILVMIVLFLTSKIWLPDDRKNETEAYNQELVLGDYYLKASGSVYDTSKKTYVITLFYGSKKDDPAPLTYAVYLNGNKDKELSYKLVRLDTPEPLYEMTIEAVPSDYYYLDIEARTLVDTVTATLTISIDYRDAKQIDSSKMIYVYVTPTPAPVITSTPYPDPTAEF
ncbi:MAG: hypothetical protein PHF65_08525 [Oscillospiraceae bacterium]|nr:hypothetical protein [Oscillospiraceae bacterium]